MGNQVTCTLGLSSCNDTKKPSELDEVQLQQNTDKLVSELRNKIRMLPVESELQIENELETEHDLEIENELVNAHGAMNDEASIVPVEDYMDDDSDLVENPSGAKSEDAQMPMHLDSNNIHMDEFNNQSISQKHIPKTRQHNMNNAAFVKSELEENNHKSAFHNIINNLQNKQTKSSPYPLHINIRDINISYNVFSQPKPKKSNKEISSLMCDLVCDDDDAECFCRV